MRVVALAGLARQEGDTDRVGALRRQRERRDLGAQEGVRDLDEDAGAVADLRVRAAGAAVVEVAQGGEALGDEIGSSARPCMSTTNATPQASCSNGGRKGPEEPGRRGLPGWGEMLGIQRFPSVWWR